MTTKLFEAFSIKTVLPTLVGVGTVISFSPSALGVTNTYFTQHNFNFFLGGNTTPGVWGFDRGSAFAYSPAAGFGSGGFGLHSYPITSAPFTHFDTTGTISRGGASATASSIVNVNSIGIGTVSGVIQASGQATAQRRGEIACASSYAGVVARQRVKLPSGSVIWGPRFNWDFVSDGTCATVRKDPISFSVTDPETGKVLNSGKFLDITHTGDGSVRWNDVLDFNLTNGTFSIDLNSEFIPEEQRGSLFLEVSQGVITRSQDGGIFDGLLPEIGSSGLFSTKAISPISFNFDLGDFGQEVDLELTGDGGVLSDQIQGRVSSRIATPVPEPTVGVFSLGIVGLLLHKLRKLRKGVN